MMPLSVGALVSGMLTLIATPPNLVVHAQLLRSGYEGFEFFSFAIFGLPILVLAMGYMVFVRRRLAGNETEAGRSTQYTSTSVGMGGGIRAARSGSAPARGAGFALGGQAS